MAALAIGSAIAFGLIAVSAVSGASTSWEMSLLVALHDALVALPGAIPALMAWTHLGDAAVVVAAAVLLAAWRVAVGDRLGALLVLAVVVGASAGNDLLQQAFGRPRPQLGLIDYPVPAGGGFPSGHAATSAAFVVALAIDLLRATSLPRRWRLGAVALVALVAAGVGFSRLALGVHYPTDVLGGWALALAWGGALSLVEQAYRARRVVSSRR